MASEAQHKKGELSAHHGCFNSAEAVGRVSGLLTRVDLTKSHHWELLLGGNLTSSLYMMSAAVCASSSTSNGGLQQQQLGS